MNNFYNCHFIKPCTTIAKVTSNSNWKPYTSQVEKGQTLAAAEREITWLSKEGKKAMKSKEITWWPHYWQIGKEKKELK